MYNTPQCDSQDSLAPFVKQLSSFQSDKVLNGKSDVPDKQFYPAALACLQLAISSRHPHLDKNGFGVQNKGHNRLREYLHSGKRNGFPMP